MASTFTWNVLSGSWTVPANWTGASGTPGASDTAIYNNAVLDFDVLGGNAAASMFSVNGDLALDGPGSFGAINAIAQNGFGILPGASVSAGQVQLSGVLQIAGPGAALTSPGTVNVGIGGTLGVYNQATMDAKSLIAGSAFVLDPNARAEIGGGAIGSAGTLAIDSGATATFEGFLGAPVLNDGVFVVTTSLVVVGAVEGDGVIDLSAPGSPAFGQVDFYDPVANTQTVVFSDSTLQTVDLFDTAQDSQDVTISGFVSGDTIGVGVTGASPETPFATSAVYTSTGANIGTLAISAGSTVLQTPTLLGDYADQSFLILPTTPTLDSALVETNDFFPEQSRVMLAPDAVAAPTAAPAGSGSDTYNWIATAGGAWATMGNWEDATTSSAATSAPGANNSVALETGTTMLPIINGDGNALSVTQSGSVALNGTFSFGDLAQAGVIDLLPGGSLAVGGASVDGFNSTLVANGARVSVGSGGLFLGDALPTPGVVDAWDGASITADFMTFDEALVWVDPTSSFELGSAGGAADGALTIDPGKTLNVDDEGGELNGNLVNNGTIMIGQGATGGTALLIGGSVSGTGVIDLAFADQIDLLGSVGSGQTIDLAGGDTILAADAAIAGSIEGFDNSDALVIDGSLVNASFAGNSSSGTLTFGNATGGDQQTQAIAGNFAGFTFLDFPDPIRFTENDIVLAAGTLQSGPPGAPPVGSGLGHTFTWNNEGGGAWSDAALWNNPSIEPGMGDTAILGGNTIPPFIVSGAGDAGEAEVLSSMALSGSFDFGTLALGTFVGGTPGMGLQIGANSTVIATHVAMDDVPLVIEGAGASLLVPGTFTIDGGETSFDVLDGAWAQLATLATGTEESIQIIRVDATSTLEIGTIGGAAAGDMTIDSGSTVTVAANTGLDVLAPVVNDGVLIANSGTLGNLDLVDGLSGDGTLVLGSNAIVDVFASIAASQTIEFTGTGDLLNLEAAGDLSSQGETTFTGSPTIEGFNSSDTITLQGQATEATYTPTGADIGTLTLSDGGAAVMTMTLLGDYTGSQFLSFASPVLVGDLPTSTLFVDATTQCYRAGTRIATPAGEVAIEDLAVGDLVLAHYAGAVPVLWAGSRTVDCRGHAKPAEVWPVRVREGAFGRGRPARDLFLSPDHAVFVDGVLVPVKYLIDAGMIVQEPVATVVYYHIELDEHDLLLAEGLLAESLLDRRAGFFADAVTRLSGETPRQTPLAWEGRGCAPLVIAGARLNAARRAVPMAVPASPVVGLGRGGQSSGGATPVAR